MKETEIRVCDCGAPLHWTFLYAGAEYFCMNCHRMYGMLGAGEMVLQTTERRARQTVADSVFKALRKYLIGSGGYKKENCKQCNERDEYHTQHLTEYERLKDRIACNILDGIKGTLGEG